jgi:hypothetical protein
MEMPFYQLFEFAGIATVIGLGVYAWFDIGTWPPY